jgi:hypothetical protein
VQKLNNKVMLNKVKDINSDLTVTDIENYIKDLYGINVKENNVDAILSMNVTQSDELFYGTFKSGKTVITTGIGGIKSFPNKGLINKIIYNGTEITKENYNDFWDFLINY